MVFLALLHIVILDMTLRLGQIVELDASGFSPPATLQTGDRGTIISGVSLNEFDNEQIKVLWHKNGRELWMVKGRLRLYTYPMMKPLGRSHGAGDTVRALAKVIDVELPHALQDVMRDLERARMENEDLRTKALSPYGTHLRIRDPGHRWLTWREVGTMRNEMCEQLSTRIVNACDFLHGAKRDALVADSGDSHRQALTQARNSMIDALNELESDFSSGDEMSSDDEDQS